ncbi:hypothetical protein HY449_00510 [Candidatus Pacearchaeota archaeon]|nr:hypothetical protein [Candidatus Pacearchaeota archaeon]
MEEGDSIQVLVEGLNHSRENRQLNYRGATIYIPKGATHINDGDFIYRFYGTTDFKGIKRENNGGLETEFVGRIRDFEHLTRPRTIIISDGRIFVEQSTSLDRSYMNLLEKEIIREAGRIFSAQNYNP